MQSTCDSGFLGPDGRPIGCHVYMLLCQDDGPVYAKIGLANDPLKRLSELRVGCPIKPWQLAYVRVRSRARAKYLEKTLHGRLLRWKAEGEWFRIPDGQRGLFNAGWREVFDELSEPGWKLAWKQVAVQPHIRIGIQNRKRLQQHWKTAGRAYQDFARESAH